MVTRRRGMPFRIFTLGQWADWMAGLIVWSPLGKHIELSQAEGPHGAYFDGLRGTITELDGDSAILQVQGRNRHSSGSSTLVRLTPRHSGWSIRSLRFVRVVVLATATSTIDDERREAIAIARSIDRPSSSRS